MPNLEKSKLKISMLKEMIDDLEQQKKDDHDSGKIWEGKGEAFQQSMDVYNSVIKTVQKSMNWNKLSKEEQEEQKEIDPKNVPIFPLKDEEGMKFCQMMKNGQTVLSSFIANAQGQPFAFESRCHVLDIQIEKIKKKIETEQAKINNDNEIVDGVDIDNAADELVGKKPEKKVIKKRTTRKKKL